MSEFGDLSMNKRVLAVGARSFIGHHLVSTHGWGESELKKAERIPEFAS